MPIDIVTKIAVPEDGLGSGSYNKPLLHMTFQRNQSTTTIRDIDTTPINFRIEKIVQIPHGPRYSVYKNSCVFVLFTASK